MGLQVPGAHGSFRRPASSARTSPVRDSTAGMPQVERWLGGIGDENQGLQGQETRHHSRSRGLVNSGVSTHMTAFSGAGRYGSRCSLLSETCSLFRPSRSLFPPQNSLLFSRLSFAVTYGIVDTNWRSEAIFKPEKRKISLLLRPVRRGLPAQPPSNLSISQHTF